MFCFETQRRGYSKLNSAAKRSHAEKRRPEPQTRCDCTCLRHTGSSSRFFLFNQPLPIMPEGTETTPVCSFSLMHHVWRSSFAAFFYQSGPYYQNHSEGALSLLCFVQAPPTLLVCVMPLNKARGNKVATQALCSHQLHVFTPVWGLQAPFRCVVKTERLSRTAVLTLRAFSCRSLQNLLLVTCHTLTSSGLSPTLCNFVHFA